VAGSGAFHPVSLGARLQLHYGLRSRMAAAVLV